VMGEFEYRDFFDYLALDNADGLSLDHTQSEIDICEEIKTKDSKNPENTYNVSKVEYGITNNINESFPSKITEKEFISNGLSNDLHYQFTKNLTRKSTWNSTDLRKSSLSSLGSTESLEKYKLPHVEQSETKLLGNKRKNAAASKEAKKEAKQERNRKSAQKSRQKKKEYVTELEQRLSQLETEVIHHKNQSKESNIGSRLNDLKSKEDHYLKYLNSSNYDNSSKTVEKRRKLQDDYCTLQNNSIIEVYKGLIKNMVPLHIRYFESNCPMLKDIYDFQCVESFLENLNHNQFSLNQAYHFQLSSEQENSFPFHVYMFYEQLKKFTLSFKEHLLKVRKFNI